MDKLTLESLQRSYVGFWISCGLQRTEKNKYKVGTVLFANFMQFACLSSSLK